MWNLDLKIITCHDYKRGTIQGRTNEREEGIRESDWE
jgi:hypothetical protein